MLLAYGKLDLFDERSSRQAPDDPYFLETLEAYFPSALAPFEDEMRRHRLRREIIATVIGNDMVNLCGPTFPRRLRAAAGCDAAALLAGFAAAKEMLRFDKSWYGIAALDGTRPRRRPACAVRRALRHPARTDLLAGPARRAAGALRSDRGSAAWQDRWRDGAGRDVVDVYQPAMDELRSAGPALLSPSNSES